MAIFVAFKLGMAFISYHNAHARFEDLDLDARSQWDGKGKIQCWIISTTKQVISIQLATMVGHFLHDLDFENIYMAWPTCYNCSLLVFVFKVFMTKLFTYCASFKNDLKKYLTDLLLPTNAVGETSRFSITAIHMVLSV